MLAITNNGHKQTESREIRARTQRTTYGQQIGEIGRRSRSEKILRVILPVNNYMHAASYMYLRSAHGYGADVLMYACVFYSRRSCPEC